MDPDEHAEEVRHKSCAPCGKHIVIPAHEADTLGYRFGELVESCDGLWVQILSTTSRLFR